MSERQFWMSFVDPDRCEARGYGVPGGPGFLGVIITQSPNVLSALIRTHWAGINPGGQVVVMELPADTLGPEWRDRLLSHAEAMSIPAP